MNDRAFQTTKDDGSERISVERTVGIELSLWYFPEFDQWKLSLSRNPCGQPILAIGPFRARWKPVTIWR